MHFISIPHNRGIRLVPASQIIRIQGCSNYSIIHFAAGYPMMVAKVLQWFEGRLPPYMFVRVHHSHLVNKLFIQKVTGTKYNNLLLSNGECIAVSRRKKGLMKASS